MSQRKRYTKQFKEEAIRLASQEGASLVQVTQDLGLNVSRLRRCCKEANRASSRAFRGQGFARDEELACLKRELGRVKQERDFCAMRRRTLPRSRNAVSLHSASSCRLSDSPDVPSPVRLGQWVFCLATQARKSKSLQEPKTTK